MKKVEMTGGVGLSAQMAVGIQGDVVVFALERHPGIKQDIHWLTYAASPARAREIAKVLCEGADLIDGKITDEGQYDSNADEFEEHHG